MEAGEDGNDEEGVSNGARGLLKEQLGFHWTAISLSLSFLLLAQSSEREEEEEGDEGREYIGGGLECEGLLRWQRGQQRDERRRAEKRAVRWLQKPLK